MTSKETGNMGETAVCRYLESKGYRIVERNFRIKGGEIDIIACRHKCLVFAEVKKRRTLDEAAYAITRKQQLRLIKGAEVFAGSHPEYKNYDLRFDAILVRLPFTVKHLPNAWTA